MMLPSKARRDFCFRLVANPGDVGQVLTALLWTAEPKDLIEVSGICFVRFMVEVPLIQGKAGYVPHGSRRRVVWRVSKHVALVDDEDAERVLTLRWRYVVTPDGSISVVALRATYLHRFILNAPKGIQVDHRDGNRLNCLRSNLRFATQSQNLQNTRLRVKGTVTGFKGVTHVPNRKGTPNRYTAKIRWQGKRLHLGWFRTAEEAASVYDDKARELFGEFACLNFPKEGEQSVRRNANKGELYVTE